MRAQASHVGVIKNTVTVLIPELKNFGMAIACRLAIAILRRNRCYQSTGHSDFTKISLLPVDCQ